MLALQMLYGTIGHGKGLAMSKKKISNSSTPTIDKGTFILEI
jgi:hypothetical protein